MRNWLLSFLIVASLKFLLQEFYMGPYYRPIVITDSVHPAPALPLAGGHLCFTHVERLSRREPPEILPAEQLPYNWKIRLCEARSSIAQVSFDRPRIMGIVNVTPDSFSDGGRYNSLNSAVKHARSLDEQGADFLDIGGESTRPGSVGVSAETEIERIEPVIDRVRDLNAAISVDTRKALVAEIAIACGASLVNDVSGFQFDPELLGLCVAKAVPVCVMHSRGLPETMQENPVYEDVVLDVFDFLETQISLLTKSGISRSKIIADPGIGFGKTIEQNLALLEKLSLFHGLGVPLLLGVSRKGFIGKLTNVERAEERVVGSVAAALTGVSQGVQIFRVHDVQETRQAFDMWQRIKFGDRDG